MKDKEIETTVLNFQLSNKMKKRLKVEAAMRGVSIRDIMLELIEKHLKEQEKMLDSSVLPKD